MWKGALARREEEVWWDGDFVSSRYAFMLLKEILPRPSG